MLHHAELRTVAPTLPCPSRGRLGRVRRSGAALVEFALIALVLYLLLAVTIEMGRSLYSAQLVQQAADVAAREISRTPLPPNVTLEQMLYDRTLPSNARVLRDIYNEDYLVVDLDKQLTPGQAFLDFFADKPIVNRQLFSLMIYEEVNGRRLLRYPGALFNSSTAPSGFTVAIPMVVSRDSTGAETIEWHRVVEEMKLPPGSSLSSASGSQQSSGNNSGGSQSGQGSTTSGSGNNTGLLTGTGSGSAPTPQPTPTPTVPSPSSLFPITSSQRGLVAVRINFPYQAAALSAYQANASSAASGQGSSNRVIEANDGGVKVQQQANGFTPSGGPIDSGQAVGPYAGPFGLGRQLALGTTVRPFSKLLTAQAIYRREVFGSFEIASGNSNP
jgi:hypothetical protein